MTDAAVEQQKAAEASAPGIFQRTKGWLFNPWGRPRFLPIITWLYMAWAIVPVLIAIQFSFNDSRSRTVWAGFSTKWYYGDQFNSVWHNDQLRSALYQSIKLAGADVLIATPIGVALALGLARWRGRGSGPSNFLMLFPLVTPEIVMGVSLLFVFTHLFTFIHTSTFAQILGHVTFSISYVVVIVRGRLFSIGRSFEEAAADLGATPRMALQKVLFPLLLPAIVASAAIVFAISIDDFVISYLPLVRRGLRHGTDRDLQRHPRSATSEHQRDCDHHGRGHTVCGARRIHGVSHLHPRRGKDQEPAWPATWPHSTCRDSICRLEALWQAKSKSLVWSSGSVMWPPLTASTSRCRAASSSRCSARRAAARPPRFG